MIVIDHFGLQPVRAASARAAFAELPKVLELAALKNVAIKISGACTLSHQPFPYKDIGTRCSASSMPSFRPLPWGTDHPGVGC
jgi:predicted TIM-barrel fold metal-dependent hydrolase